MLLEDVTDGPPRDGQAEGEAKRPMMVSEGRGRQPLMRVPDSSKSGTAELADTDGESLGCVEAVECAWQCHEAEAVGVQPNVGSSLEEVFAVHRWLVAVRAGLAAMEDHAEARTRIPLILLMVREASKAK